MRTTTFLLGCMVGMGALMTGRASMAVPVLDANYDTEPTSGYAVSISGQNSIGQTFTTLSSGTLSSVALYVANMFAGTETYTVDVKTTTGGSPAGGVVLASGSFSNASITGTGFYSLDLSSYGAALVAGTTYGITVSSDDAGILFYGVNPGGYADGSMFQNSVNASGDVGSATQADLLFQTFIDPVTEVPEPATVSLLLAGCILAACGRLRRLP